jgi:hypothetical protein
MARRKLVDEAEAMACLEAQRESGVELGAWARSNGLDGRSLNCWRINLERKAEAAVGRMNLVELVPTEATEVAASLVVRWGEFTVEVPDAFQDRHLARVLQVLQAC